MKFQILKYGVIGGLIASALGTLNWILVARPIGVEASQIIGYIGITASLLCIPFGINYFKQRNGSGNVSFKQAYIIGLGITSYAALVMAIHSVIFFFLQRDEFIEWQRNDLSGAELAAFEEQLSSMPGVAFNPWFQGVVMFAMVFLIGAIVNLISSLVLSSKDNENVVQKSDA